MAFIQMNIFSASLMRTVPVNVILPIDKMAIPGMPVRGDKPYKTLYLLHGLLGNYEDWVTGTSILRYAEENDIAVVMPSGDNANYIDHPAGMNFYGNFIGKELVELTRKMFPLSHQREDTYIGGLSMGGYGALRNGLKYHDTFGAVVALSSALIVDDAPNRKPGEMNPLLSREFAEATFGDLSTLLESDRNPKYLVEQMCREGVKFPEIYMACGEDDSLLENNNDFAEFLRSHNVNVTYEVGAGNHEWDFWDRYIKKGIQWLPVEKTGLGMNSGNVGI